MAQGFTSLIRPQQAQRRGGQYTPALRRMSIAAPASLLAATILAALIYWLLRRSVALSAASNLEVVKTTVTVTAFAGAVLAGVRLPQAAPRRGRRAPCRCGTAGGALHGRRRAARARVGGRAPGRGLGDGGPGRRLGGSAPDLHR